MGERQPSLRRDLLWLLVGATGIVWLVVAAATYLDARQRASELFDAQLQEYSEVLSAIGGHEMLEMEGETTAFDHGKGPPLAYQVYDATGRVVIQSHAAPARPLADADGFQDVRRDAAAWRVFRRTDATGLVIIVAQGIAGREALIRDIALSLLVPLALGLPVLGVALWLAVSKSLAPLLRLAADVSARAPDQLEPLEERRAPREVLPLVDALNDLFRRLGRSFANERRFTGDAAHELRTPLAAVKTQAQVALSSPDAERRRRALENVVAGVDRATRLVEQLLALARLDAMLPPSGGIVEVGELAAETVRDLASQAEDRGVRVGVEAGEGAQVRGERELLRLLVRNLVDNAIRYTPRGGQVRVRIRETTDAVVLTVSDSGPGVEPEMRERIFDRFFRVAGEHSTGSGLGLSIVQAVVALHGGSIQAGRAEDLGGLEVVATLPRLHKDSLRNAA